MSRTTPDRFSDVAAAVFKVQPEFLESLSGLDFSAQLRVASGMSAEDLDRISRDLTIHLLADDAGYVPSATGIVMPLLVAERPYVAHVAALHTRELLLGADPVSVGAVLDEQVEFLGSNWATHRATVSDLARLKVAEDDEERALAESELAVKTAEGPVRRGAWIALRLLGADPGPLPRLNELAERCAKEDHYLTGMFGLAIHPELRNAIAHREFEWDSTSNKLLMRGHPVDPGELRYRRVIGTSLLAGFECGVVMARSSSRELQRSISLRTPAMSQPQRAKARVADLLAERGVIATGISVTKDVVRIRLMAGTVADLAPVVAALTLRWFDLGLVRVCLQVADRPPLSISKETAGAVRRLLLRNNDQVNVPPTALFPLIASARAEAGGKLADVYDEISQRALWIGLECGAAMLGFRDGSTSPSPREARSKVNQAVDALVGSWRLLPGRPPASLAGHPQLLRRLASSFALDDQQIEASTQLVHEACRRDDPPTLEWFDPLALGEVERDQAG